MFRGRNIYQWDSILAGEIRKYAGKCLTLFDGKK
jgi:hypothetical protein